MRVRAVAKLPLVRPDTLTKEELDVAGRFRQVRHASQSGPKKEHSGIGGRPISGAEVASIAASGFSTWLAIFAIGLCLVFFSWSSRVSPPSTLVDLLRWTLEKRTS